MGAQSSSVSTSTQEEDAYFGVPYVHRIERRNRLTPEEFEREYYNKKKPVIITGVMDDWPAMQKWTHAYMREKIGARKHTFRYGRETVQMKVSEYMDAAEKYTEEYKRSKEEQRGTSDIGAATLFPKLPDSTDEKSKYVCERCHVRNVYAICCVFVSCHLPQQTIYLLADNIHSYTPTLHTVPYMRHFGPLNTLPELQHDVHPERLFSDPSKVWLRSFLFLGVPGMLVSAVTYDTFAVIGVASVVFSVVDR